MGMGNEDFTLPVLYIRHIADQMRSTGGDVERWLEESGVCEAQLVSPSFAIDYQGFERLVLNALAVAREPALGLFVGQRLVANSHGMLGYAALSSGTIRQALELFERYARLRISLLSIALDIGSDEVSVRFDETRSLGDIRRPLLEAVVLSVKNVLEAISSGVCEVTEISFPFETPVYAALARRLFACEVKYGRRWTGFTLPRAVMDVPLTMADPETFREASLICQRQLDTLALDEPFAALVRQVLLEKQNHFPSLQVIARRLRMTPRTLHRRLLQEGTSYRQLLEEVRHALAVEQLKSGRFRMEEIAYALGYSDLANFRRAFKRWESVPPSARRVAHAARTVDETDEHWKRRSPAR